MNGRIATVIAVIALLLALNLHFESSRDRLGANRIVAAVEQATLAAQQRGSLPGSLIQRHLEYLRRAEELDPAEIAVPIAQGGQYFLSRRYSAAERAFQEALIREPRPEIYVFLARTYLAMEKKPEALEAIRNAILLDTKHQRTFRDVLAGEHRLRAWLNNRFGGASEAREGLIFEDSFERGSLSKWRVQGRKQ